MVLPGITCKIMDNKGNEMPIGEKGEIVIKGENVMKGYYLSPEVTNSTIKDGWLWTGDLGYIDENGFLVVIGREKALLIAANGEKYSPEGIEEAIINSSELISQVMVYNDMCPYTVAVANLEHSKVKALIKVNNIKSTKELLPHIEQSFNAFRRHPSYNGQIPDVWAPKSFIIGTEDFTEQNQMINSTMKMVRHKVLSYYKAELNYMYESVGKQTDNPKNHTNLEALYFKKA